MDCINSDLLCYSEKYFHKDVEGCFFLCPQCIVVTAVDSLYEHEHKVSI